MNILYNQQARMTACLLEVARILCLHVIEEIIVTCNLGLKPDLSDLLTASSQIIAEAACYSHAP
jgi:hypothetical protein